MDRAIADRAEAGTVRINDRRPRHLLTTRPARAARRATRSYAAKVSGSTWREIEQTRRIDDVDDEFVVFAGRVWRGESTRAAVRNTMSRVVALRGPVAEIRREARKIRAAAEFVE
jgi:hypothetical protein